jgi:hypothetical protein
VLLEHEPLAVNLPAHTGHALVVHKIPLAPPDEALGDLATSKVTLSRKYKLFEFLVPEEVRTIVGMALTS